MSESWKPVVGYEAFYEVSDIGNVRSFDRIMILDYSKYGRREVHRKGKDHEGFVDESTGIRKLQIRANSKRTNQSVSSAIAAAFIGPRPEGYVTFNIDRDKTNCVLTNIVYLPRSVLMLLNSCRETARDKGEILLGKYVSGELQ